MSDLSALCHTARERGRKLLSIYLTCSFPNREWTVPMCEEIFAAGADLIELGIPFSDPIADGPVIQAAAMRSLQNGFQVRDVFETARAVSAHGHVLLMGYYNSLLAQGSDSFLKQAMAAAVSALIIPDLLLEEDRELWSKSREQNIPLIPFLSPTTPATRCAAINSVAAPFVYAVSLTGVTGARETLPQDTIDYLVRSRQLISAPLLVGFGISSAESARRLKPHCDGVIVGSAIIRLIEQAGDLAAARAAVGAFVRELRHALDS